jgi:hypothetical protein
LLLVDDILLFPVRGVLWIFREIHRAAQQEVAREEESITVQLSNLYMMLETSQITEEEFETQEKTLLDRLDRLEKRRAVEEDQEQEDVEEHVRSG